ncbi:hypothetical protein HQ945_08340 [Phyllobacterium sp. BT25]|uniref:Tape measure protein N-terminal domain-containing protein n=1 Tax=Phyllobacterium pellucidum TaxID=2740464 RepID=A0A849VMY8_9HYPH|nr:tape measure protein [Phyllobacterium pellucidum]NTS31262.1 hypothetical protein [Phyllobacterium pellucidum]
MAIVDELIAILGYEVTGEAELKHYNKSLDALEKKVENVGRRIGQAAAFAGAAVAAGFAFLGKGVLDTSAKFESYQATLETIEGSADKAKAALDWVSQFAKTTPYEVDEVTQAFVKLRAYGMDPMDGTLTSLGDTASGMGKNLMQAVEALADAATGEFERIKEFGVKAKVAGDNVTFSWVDNGKQMTKTVKKTGVEVTKTLKEIWGKRFAGAMIRQSKTWNGMMSNLGDSWTAFLRKIGDAGIFDKVKGKLGDFMDALNTWFDDGTVDEIAKGISGAFERIDNMIGSAVQRVVFYTKNFEKVKPYLEALGIALGILVAATFPVTAAFIGLAIAVDDVVSYMTGGESVIGDFVNWLNQLWAVVADNEAIKALGDIIRDLVNYFTDAATFAAGFFSALTDWDSGAVTEGFRMFGEVMGGVVTLFKDLIGAMFRLLEWAIPDDFFGDAFENGRKAAQTLIDVLNTIIGLPAKIVEAFAGLGQRIADQITAGSAAVRAAIAGMVPSTINMPAFVGGGLSSGAGLTPAQIGANAGSNFGRMAGSGPTVNRDASQKTINSNVNVGGVNVTVQSPTQAPGAVGAAVGRAVGQAATPQATRIEAEPSF